jgi:hypothetical protein
MRLIVRRRESSPELDRTEHESIVHSSDQGPSTSDHWRVESDSEQQHCQAPHDRWGQVTAQTGLVALRVQSHQQ